MLSASIYPSYTINSSSFSTITVGVFHPRSLQNETLFSQFPATLLPLYLIIPYSHSPFSPPLPIPLTHLQPKMIEKDAKGGKEIPIPGCLRVPSYQIDYLPVAKDRYTYIRGKGGLGYDDPTHVEYDADVEDEKWVREFNGAHEKLTIEKFELMVWKLELANAAATDRAFAFAGASLAERSSKNACAATEHLLKDEALNLLEEQSAARESIRVAVYDYWLAKRKRLERPLLRRLQAPTPIGDNDPYHVFRPRERQNRAQTRRRRENNEDSLEKLKMIRNNLIKGLDVFELLVRRERKKRDMVYVETDMYQLQIKQRHEPRGAQEAIEQDYAAAARNKNPKRPIGFEAMPEAAPATTNTLLDFKNKKNKKRKKLGELPQLNAVAQLPPQPIPPQPNLLATFVPDTDRLDSIKLNLSKHGGHPSTWGRRIGRGGRLIFVRQHPFNFEPSTPSDDKAEEASDEQKERQPFWEMENPYSEWSNRHELAAAALARLDALASDNAAAAIATSDGKEEEEKEETKSEEKDEKDKAAVEKSSKGDDVGGAEEQQEEGEEEDDNEEDEDNAKDTTKKKGGKHEEKELAPQQTSRRPTRERRTHYRG